MTDRIVVGLDGSNHSLGALEFAVAEVRRRGDAVLIGLYANHMPVVYGFEAGVPFPNDELERMAREELGTWLADVPADISVQSSVALGSPARALLAASREADLVVVGSRGRGGFRSLVLGSTSHQVVAHAHCPVVVVPDEDRDVHRGDVDPTSGVG